MKTVHTANQVPISPEAQNKMNFNKHKAEFNGFIKKIINTIKKRIDKTLSKYSKTTLVSQTWYC